MISTAIPTKKTSFCASWFGNNIFSKEYVDAGLYSIFYMLFPVLLTYISLTTCNEGSDILSKKVFAYISIWISASNCMYDAYNRRERGKVSVKNTKLFLLGLFTFATWVYCIVQIVWVVTYNGDNLPNCVFCIYLGAIAIAACDIGTTIIPRLVFKDPTSVAGDDTGGGKE